MAIKQSIRAARMIRDLRLKFPEAFLGIEHISIRKELILVGIFKCLKCSRPILHPQMAWSGLCPPCDLGKDSPKWSIKKPLIEQVADEI